MAIEDAYVLATCLAKQGTISKAFARYEVLRKERATRVQERSYKNGLVYHATVSYTHLTLPTICSV